MLIFGPKGACNKCKPLCNNKIYTVPVQLSVIHEQHHHTLTTQDV